MQRPGLKFGCCVFALLCGVQCLRFSFSSVVTVWFFDSVLVTLCRAALHSIVGVGKLKRVAIFKC